VEADILVQGQQSCWHPASVVSLLPAWCRR